MLIRKEKYHMLDLSDTFLFVYNVSEVEAHLSLVSCDRDDQTIIVFDASSQE